MSFVAMGVAAGTTLAAGGSLAAAGTAAMAGTAAASGLGAAALGTTAATAGGIAGGALGGATLGAGVGAAGAGITGGDVGEGAAMGAATGALTAGIGTGVATPVTTAATSGGSTAGQVAGAAAKEGTKAAATNIGGGVAAEMGTAGTAATAGASRFGVGMASGEDLEDAGLAGLTAAGSAGIMGGLSDLASSPSYNPGGGNIQYSGQGGELPGGPLQSLDSAINAKVALGEIPGHPGYLDTSTASDALGNVGTSTAAAPSGTLGGAYDTFAAEQASAAVPGLGDRAYEGIGSVAENLDTWDKVSDAAGHYKPELLATGVGLTGTGSLEALEKEEDEYGYTKDEREAERQKVIQSIKESYAAAGRDMPLGLEESYAAVGRDAPLGFDGRPLFSDGGIAGLTRGPGDGTGDRIPAVIDGKQPAALSTDEFIIPADVVSHIGNGSTTAGAKTLYSMMRDIRNARTKSSKQPKDIDPDRYLPA